MTCHICAKTNCIGECEPKIQLDDINVVDMPAQQEPVAFGALAKRRVFDYIRGAYDLGYNDARNAKAIPGDNAPGYKGRDVETDHGSALLHALEGVTSPPAQRKPLTDEWVPVTEKLLNEQHPWLYQPMWIVMKGAVVVQGYYEWRQGRNPDRFITDLGDEWAFNADFVMPITKPTPPASEAAHGIKEQP